MNASGFRDWRAAYEAAGIGDTERAPAALVALATGADVFLSSDAPRAVQSAHRLANGREIVVSPLLRELDLEGPELGGLSLPFHAWALAVGWRMLQGRLRGQYPSLDERGRIDRAAEWVANIAAQHECVVIVTHVSVRKQLWVRLLRSGWRPEPGRRTLRPWSAWGCSRSSQEE